MRHVVVVLAAAAVLVLGAAGVAQARPVVSFGTVAAGACNLGTQHGCVVRPVWFSNHTDSAVTFTQISTDGVHFALAKSDTRPARCEAHFRIPAHGVCEVLVIGGADHTGPNQGILALGNGGTPVRQARLVITGR
jgi:hypothetical protein